MRPKKPIGPEAVETGQNVRANRTALHLSGSDLRDVVHPTSLSFIERARQEPTLAQIRSLAQRFKVTPAKLLGSWIFRVPAGRRAAAQRQPRRAGRGASA